MRALLIIIAIASLTGCAMPGGGNASFNPNLSLTFSLYNSRGHVDSTAAKDNAETLKDTDILSEGGGSLEAQTR